MTTRGPAGDDNSGGRVSSRHRQSTADRVAKMLARKPDARPAEVATRLGVSERTVQRYWPTPNGRTRQ